MIALYYEHYFDSHCLYFENVSNGCDYCVVLANMYSTILKCVSKFPIHYSVATFQHVSTKIHITYSSSARIREEHTSHVLIILGTLAFMGHKNAFASWET